VQWSTRQVGGGGGGGAGAGAGVYGVVGMVMVGVVMVWCVSVVILFKQVSPSGPTVASLNRLVMWNDNVLNRLPQRHLVGLAGVCICVAVTSHWSAMETLAAAIVSCMVMLVIMWLGVVVYT